MVKNLPAMQEARVPSLRWEDTPGEGHGNALQYSGLENSTDWEAWRVTWQLTLSHFHSIAVQQLFLCIFLFTLSIVFL